MSAQHQRQIAEAAATWYVQFQSAAPTDSQRQAWRRWLDSDPAHRRAWEQMELLQAHLGTLPADATRRALSSRQQRRQVLKLVAVAGALGMLGWSARDSIPPGEIWAQHRTALGEHSAITLADDTRVELNTDTAVDILYDSTQRLIRLYKGEILVTSGKRGDSRPLMVATGDGRVQALGTVFSVRKLSTATRVGVLEDEIQLWPEDAYAQECRLRAGQSADFDRLHVSAPRLYVKSEAAWVNGQLIVLDASLGDVIEELGRYRRGVMRCDEGAKQLRVSGTFKVNDVDAVLGNLQSTLPITVRYFTRYWVSLERR